MCRDRCPRRPFARRSGSASRVGDRPPVSGPRRVGHAFARSVGGAVDVADVDAGSAVIATIAFVLVSATALAFGVDFDAGELWPFLVLGMFVPGLSQLLVVHAVQAAGASRAGILFGMAPLFSAAVAIVAFSEPLRWPLAAGTLLVVSGGLPR